MATIIVEDGTIVPNANSYVSEAFLVAYAADRGITLTGTDSVTIIKAMDYLENLPQPFQGYKNEEIQPLQWPRTGVWIDGYDVDTDIIPSLLQQALCELCIGIDQGENPLQIVGRSIKKESVGGISFEYADGTRDTPYIKSAMYKLRKLISVRSSGGNIVVARA